MGKAENGFEFFVQKKMTKAEMQVKRVSEPTEERAVFEAKTKAEAEAYIKV